MQHAAFSRDCAYVALRCAALQAEAAIKDWKSLSQLALGAAHRRLSASRLRRQLAHK